MTAHRAALLASAPRLPDALTPALPAGSIKATVWLSVIKASAGRMSPESADHHEAATEPMRWTCQLTAEMPAGPQTPDWFWPHEQQSRTSDPRWKSIHTARRPDQRAARVPPRHTTAEAARHEPDL